MVTKENLLKEGIKILTESELENYSCSGCDSPNLIFVKKIEVQCNCKFSLKKTEPYLLLTCSKCGKKHAGRI